MEKNVLFYGLRNARVKSIYFGGGTPSVMPEAFFENTLASIYENFKVLSGAEITVEVNPESAGLQKLKELRAAGANRLSMGIQSFDDRVLKTAGRIHAAADADRAAANARTAGFKNISADLILGLPEQSEKILHNDIKHLAELNPEHISAYMLSIENGTKFYEVAQNNSGSGPPPFLSDEEIARYYEIFCGEIAGYGYFQYEISNFARKNFESRHNINYWERGEYLGIGPSASSFLKRESGVGGGNNRDTLKAKTEIRKTNVPDLKKYAENVLRNNNKNDNNANSGYFEYEILTEKDRINEELFLSLRMNRGMNMEKLGVLVKPETIKGYINRGLMKRRGKNIALTVRGMLLSSEIIAGLMV